MAIKIPSYDTQQVQQRAAPTPNVVVNMPNMQESFAKPASVGLNVLNDMVTEANAARVKEFQLELDRWDTQTLLGYKSKPGRLAFDKTIYGDQGPTAFLEAERKKFLESKYSELTTNQRKQAELIASASGVRFNAGLSEHQIVSNKVYSNSVNENAVRQNSDALAIVNPEDKDEVNNRMAGIADGVAARLAGMDPSWAIKEAQSKAVVDVITNAAESKIVIDKRYDHMKSFLTEGQKKDLEVKLAGKNEDNKSFALAQAFTGDILDSDARNAYAKSVSGGDASLYKKLTGLLDYDGASRKAKIDGASGESTAKYTTELVNPRANLTDIEKTIGADKTLTSDDRAKLAIRVQAQREHRIALSDKFKADAEKVKALATARAAFDLKYSPNIGDMSDDKFQDALDKIHVSHHEGLYAARAMAKATGGKTVVPKALIKSVAEQNGLKEDSIEATTAAALVSSRIESESKGKGIYASSRPSDIEYLKMLGTYMKKRDMPGTDRSLAEIQSMQLEGKDITKERNKLIESLGGENRLKVIRAYLGGKGMPTDRMDLWLSAEEDLKDMHRATPDQYFKLERLAFGLTSTPPAKTVSTMR